MKFSSISLIAVAGSVIAAPCPLYTRALERLNSFERDLDVDPRESVVAVLERDVDGDPVDDLFARSVVGRHQGGHNRAAEHLQAAIKANERAARYAAQAAKVQSTPDEIQYWEGESRKHENSVATLQNLYSSHTQAARLSSATDLHRDVDHAIQIATESTRLAALTTMEAKHVIRH